MSDQNQRSLASPQNSEGSDIQDLGSLHHYRTEIPNIIFRMNLDPWVFKAYCVFKMTAGDRSSCFKSNSTLSDEIGCSIPTLIKLKGELADLGLITIQKRHHENGGSMPDLIQIVDIWAQNMDYMLSVYPKKSTPLQGFKDSKIYGGGKQDLGGGVNAVNQGSKPGLDKQEPYNKNPKEQQQASPKSAAGFSDLLDSVDIPTSDKVWLCEKYDEATIHQAIKWATHPLTKINTTLAQAIKWACINKPAIPIDQADLTSANKEYAKSMEMQYNPMGEKGFQALSSGVLVFSTKSQAASIEIPYTDKNFKTLLISALRKFNIIKE